VLRVRFARGPLEVGIARQPLLGEPAEDQAQRAVRLLEAQRRAQQVLARLQAQHVAAVERGLVGPVVELLEAPRELARAGPGGGGQRARAEEERGTPHSPFSSALGVNSRSSSATPSWMVRNRSAVRAPVPSALSMVSRVGPA